MTLIRGYNRLSVSGAQVTYMQCVLYVRSNLADSDTPRPWHGQTESKDTTHNLEINRFRRKMFERDLGRYVSRSEPKGACLDGMNGEMKLVQRLKPKYK